jgi:RNA polymerase sigma-70 factor (ECF subfamily)
MAVSGEEGLEQLYTSSFGRLVRVVALACGDVSEAEEAVQEAFARLVPRWATVSRYDDPEAWVRSVAFRLVRKRWRKLRNGRTVLSRLAAPDAGPAPAPDAVDISRALAGLPLGQRQVVVLHYLIGLDLAAVASELGIPIGTCKSRLFHARAALQPLLSEDLHA